MLDDEQRQGLGQRGEQLEDARGFLRTHARGRLIEKQQQGLLHERKTDLELALGAVGESGDPLAEVVGEPQAFGVLLGFLAQGGEASRAPPEHVADAVLQRAGERQILADGQPREEVVALEAARQSLARPRIRRGTAQAAAAEEDFSPRRLRFRP